MVPHPCFENMSELFVGHLFVISEESVSEYVF